MLFRWVKVSKGVTRPADMLVDATGIGRHLNGKYNFIMFHDEILVPATVKPSEEWLKLRDGFATAQ